MTFAVHLSKESTVPLHRQLAKELHRLIAGGKLATGRKLPSTRSLAKALNVSRATVSLAYEQLLRNGLLEAYTGSGTYVSREIPPINLDDDTKEEESPPGVEIIDFTPSQPQDQMPIAPWRKLLADRVAQTSIPDYCGDPRGYSRLRDILSRHLHRTRSLKCTPDQVILVENPRQALDLVCRVHLIQNKRVAVQNPCYRGAADLFSLCGSGIRPFDAADDDFAKQLSLLSIDSEEVFSAYDLVYATPACQAPEGTSLSPAHRKGVLEFARACGAYVLEDDYGSDFGNPLSALPTLFSLDQDERVIHVGSFSKAMFPSVRIAYLIVPKSLVPEYLRVKQLCGMSPLLAEQYALCDFISDGHLERHIRNVRLRHLRLRQLAADALRMQLPGLVSTVGEDGAAAQMAVRFARELDDETIQKAARQAGVRLRNMSEHYLCKPAPGMYILCFSGLAEDKIELGIKRFASALLQTVTPNIVSTIAV